MTTPLPPPQSHRPTSVDADAAVGVSGHAGHSGLAAALNPALNYRLPRQVDEWGNLLSGFSDLIDPGSPADPTPQNDAGAHLPSRSHDELLVQIMNGLPEGIWVRTVESPRLIYVNPSFLNLTDHQVKTGDPLSDVLSLIHPGDRETVLFEINRHPLGGINQDCRVRRPSGDYHWVNLRSFGIRNRLGEVTRVGGLVTDIQTRKHAEMQLNDMLLLDPLTNLPTRNSFMDRVGKMIYAARQQNLSLLIAVLDLDGFKTLNDTMGRQLGDTLLQQVGKRLKVLFKDENTAVCRLAGDEFAVAILAPAPTTSAMSSSMGEVQPSPIFIEGHQHAHNQPAHSQNDSPDASDDWAIKNWDERWCGDINSTAIRLLGNVKAPFFVDGKPLRIGATIGLARFPDHADNVADLLHRADLAMIEARGIGRNQHRIYHPSMDETLQQKRDLEVALQKAVHDKEFVLYYQPKIDINTGSCVGMEALLRWNKPKLGPVLPSFFVQALEESGLIVPLGNWVVEEACRQMQEWYDMGLPELRVAVNVSARQILSASAASVLHPDMSFESTVCQSLKKYPAAKLDLELTESTLMTHSDQVMGVLKRLKSAGVRWSIDDFGTGYSSLAYLKRFPLETLKIDRSFISEISSNAEDEAIVRAIITMAHSLKLNVVAEGVERRDQLDLLKGLQCDQIQGHIVSHAIPGSDVMGWMSQNVDFFVKQN